MPAPLATANRTFPAFNPTAEQKQGPAFGRPRPRELTHNLSESQLESFWDKGYLTLPGLFTPEEGLAFQQEAARIYQDERVDADNQRYDFAVPDKSKPQERALWKIDPFHDLSELFTAMVYDRRILDALASIYNGREPRLFKDKLIYKPPHTHGNGLHQDYNWWQSYPTSLISVAISIDAATEENGCTCVYPGYEKGYIGEPGTFDCDELAKNIDLDQKVKNITQPGDVILFTAFTPHEAGPNTTDQTRRQAFITYSDSADGEHYREHYEHYLWYTRNSYSDEQKQRLYFK